MYEGKTVFSQVLNFMPKRDFRRAVNRYDGNKHLRTFKCWDQFLCMAFAQFTYRQSLRDAVVCLRAMGDRLYHIGIRGRVSRNTLSRANNKRDWRIYQDFAQVLIKRARKMYADEELGMALDNTVYALDSSMINMCMSLFPWAKYSDTQHMIKLHTLLDLRGSIPSFIAITSGKVHDMPMLDNVPVEPGAFYIMDRGYLDFGRLYTFHQAKAFFVIRAKENTLLQRVYSYPIDKLTNVCSDQTVKLTGPQTKKHYPEHLRRVRFYDEENQVYLIFLTNNFELPALTIAQLYRSRWQIELFFKWIKQHLRIKTFFGTSENAVKTQIWIAVAAYVTVAIMKKQLKLELSLYTILQILSVTIFEKTPILSVFQDPCYSFHTESKNNQLNLFTI